MDKTMYRCPACKKDTDAHEFIEGVCPACAEKGYWMDPAGTLQQGEDEPRRMYE